MTHSLKRFFTVMFVLLLSVSLSFAADDVKRITAYKQSMDGFLPKKSVSVRCLTSVGDDIASGSSMVFSDAYRKNNLLGFSWICSGNVFGEVSVSFEFQPLKHIDTDKTANNLIYYKVEMKHVESRIGNSTVTIGKAPSTDEGLRRVFPTDSAAYTNKRYAIIYADNCTSPARFDVKTAAVTKSVTYDFSTYSKVYLRTETGDSATTSTVYKTALSTNTDYQNTCEYWNRYGSAYIELDVTEGNSGDTTIYKTGGNSILCDTGWYTADIKITIEAN